MRRRAFITLIGGAVAWLRMAQAQQMPMIVSEFGTTAGFCDWLAAFRQGLQEISYREGQNVAIEYRWAGGQNERLPALAADLVGRRVAVIATPSHRAPRLIHARCLGAVGCRVRAAAARGGLDRGWQHSERGSD